MVGVFEGKGAKAMRLFEGLRMGENLEWKRLALRGGEFRSHCNSNLAMLCAQASIERSHAHLRFTSPPLPFYPS